MCTQVGGVSIQELNRMEVSMLQLLDYKLVLTVDATRHYLKLLLGGSMVLGSGEGSSSSMSAARKRRSGNGSMCERRQSRRSSASSGGGGLSSGPHSSGYQDPDDQDDEEMGREAGGENGEVASGEHRAETAETHVQQQRAEDGVDGLGDGVKRSGQVNVHGRQADDLTAEVLRQGLRLFRPSSSPPTAGGKSPLQHQRHHTMQAPVQYTGVELLQQQRQRRQQHPAQASVRQHPDTDLSMQQQQQLFEQRMGHTHPTPPPSSPPLLHSCFHSFSQVQHPVSQHAADTRQRHSMGQEMDHLHRHTLHHTHHHTHTHHHSRHSPRSRSSPHQTPYVHQAPSVPRSAAAVTFAGTFRDDENDDMSDPFFSRRSQSHAGNTQQPSSPQQQRSHSEKLPRCRAHVGRDAFAGDANGVGGQEMEDEGFGGGSRRQRQSSTSPAPVGLHRHRATGSDMQQ